MEKHYLCEINDNLSDDKFHELKSMQKLKHLQCKNLNEILVSELRTHLPELTINEEINVDEVLSQNQLQTNLWDVKPTKISLFKRKYHSCL